MHGSKGFEAVQGVLDAGHLAPARRAGLDIEVGSGGRGVLNKSPGKHPHQGAELGDGIHLFHGELWHIVNGDLGGIDGRILDFHKDVGHHTAAYLIGRDSGQDVVFYTNKCIVENARG